MKKAIANAEAEKLRERTIVEEATVELTHRGPKIVVKVADRIAQDKLEADVHNFQTWIEVIV